MSEYNWQRFLASREAYAVRITYNNKKQTLVRGANGRIIILSKHNAELLAADMGFVPARLFKYDVVPMPFAGHWTDINNNK